MFRGNWRRAILNAERVVSSNSAQLMNLQDTERAREFDSLLARIEQFVDVPKQSRHEGEREHEQNDTDSARSSTGWITTIKIISASSCKAVKAMLYHKKAQCHWAFFTFSSKRIVCSA